MASTEKDRIIVARIAGAASRHARAHPLSHAEQQDAIAELAAVADGRADLLAEHAGLAIGCHEGDLDEPRHLRAAQLCINAGADTSLIPRWIEEGRRRAAAAADRHRRLIAAARHPGVGGRSAVSHGTRSRHPGGSLRRDSAEHDAVGPHVGGGEVEQPQALRRQLVAVPARQRLEELDGQCRAALPALDPPLDRKSTRLNSSHSLPSRMPSSA